MSVLPVRLTKEESMNTLFSLAALQTLINGVIFFPFLIHGEDFD
jgi:hypothetical protein